MMERYKQCYKQSNLHMLFLISFLGKEKDKIKIKQSYFAGKQVANYSGSKSFAFLSVLIFVFFKKDWL